MRLRYMTSTLFSKNPGKAKKIADKGPVVITDHGKAAYVLVRYAEFQANWRPKSLYDALRDPHATVDGDFDPDRLSFTDRDAAI
jgi:PHD/YefM family antitoxin component YafN of YafNO toxin-antitoxin module